MRVSFERPPLDIIADPEGWWNLSRVIFCQFTDDFNEWLAMSDIRVQVTGDGRHLEMHWQAANDEDPPKVIHFDFTREQDALAFKMRWL